ncbi:MAG: glycogen synthase GlgA [Hyphomicrobiales bacterium]|nr:MAG: glycogen synthase GlgA [Hyphomicrobiales bacterium]
MKILFVASEVYPLVKTGGLGDVAGALPPALMELGEDVRIMMPAYPQALDAARNKKTVLDLGDPFSTGPLSLISARMPSSEAELLLVDSPSLYRRDGGPYQQENGDEWLDNHIRFAALSHAAAALSAYGSVIGWTPELFHANDWQTGLLPAYLRFHHGNPAKCLYTIHNLNYTGRFPAEILPQVNLPWEAYSPDGLEFHDAVSYMKSGLYYADHITTVSRTYAQEIQTPFAGNGFEGLLLDRSSSLTGIVNGVDYQVWNPAHDPHIAAKYQPGRMGGKQACKTALQQELGLPEDPKAPLFGMVSRLTEQKGIDLILDTLPTLERLGGQLVILGTGEDYWEQLLLDRAAASPNIAVKIAYQESLSHRIIAGCDMFMMPSRFEPCGLTQLYALKYGTPPVVHRTGGLADTVRGAGAGPDQTGFVFDDAVPELLAAALEEAVDAFNHRNKWDNIVTNGMQDDYSWENSAKTYQTLYRSL